MRWILLTSALFTACAPNPTARTGEPGGASTIRPAAIEAHMRYLASDLLEGREAGTRGYDLAASYVASQFQQLGLRPAGRDNGYLQTVPFQAFRLVKDGTRM